MKKNIVKQNHHNNDCSPLQMLNIQYMYPAGSASKIAPNLQLADT